MDPAVFGYIRVSQAEGASGLATQHRILTGQGNSHRVVVAGRQEVQSLSVASSADFVKGYVRRLNFQVGAGEKPILLGRGALFAIGMKSSSSL